MGADEPVESVDIRPSDRIRSEWRPNESALEGTVAIVNLLLFFSVKSSPKEEEEEDDLWLAALLPSPRKLPRKLKVGILLLVEVVEVAVPPFMTWILWQLLASLVVLYPSSEMSDPLSPPPPPPPAVVVVVVVVVLVLFDLLLPPQLLLPPAAVA